MPRPKTITWDRRVAVFLAYRRSGGKVNPVANRHAIARSTVRVIVSEFVAMGFSEKPRAKVSADLLEEMQEHHLASLVQSPGMGVGNLDLGPGTANETGREEAASNPLPVQEESLWHLKGTKGERVIREARAAASDYLQRESEAWQSLRMALEGACKLPEREGAIGQDPEPHLLPALKRRLRNAFFDWAFQGQPPPPNWLQWELALDDPRVLKLQGEHVGLGGAEDHQRIKEGLMAFLANGFQANQRSFSEVERLRRDMMLMQEIVAKTLGAITEDEIRRGICPACPYPEAGLEPGTSASKRGARKE